MRNYIKWDNKKDFIMGYDIKDNDIIIRYGDNSTSKVSYSRDKEKELLEKMKEQVLASKVNLSEFKNKADIFKKLLLDELVLLLMFIIAIVSVGIPVFTMVMGFSIFLMAISFTCVKLEDYIKIRDDIRKRLLFVNNEECLNIKIRNQPEVVRNLDECLYNKTFPRGLAMPFSLNTINNIEYRDLKDIYNLALDINKKRILVRRNFFKRKKEK